MGLQLGGGSDRGKYYLILIIAILMVVAARNILKTRVGRSFVAIRDSDIAAEVIGINLTFYKTLSFMVSAFYTGLAGGLLVSVGFFRPFHFYHDSVHYFSGDGGGGGLGVHYGFHRRRGPDHHVQYSLLEHG